LRLEERTGRPARLSWFLRMDPQVSAVFGSAHHVVDVHPELLADTAEHGDALGLHIHAWRMADDGWLDDYLSSAWFGECIDRSFDAFADAFGRPCALTRLGSRYLDEPAAQRLAALDVAVDLTVEPGSISRPDGSIPRLRGALPDYRRSPRRPHEVVPGLTELPLTASRKSLGRNVRAHLSRMRRHGLTQRLDQPLPIGQPAHGPEPFGEQVRASLALQGRPYLAFAVRSDSLLDPILAERLEAHLEALVAIPEASRFTFTTPHEALALLRA
jgi:hypothetical protein